MDHAKKRVMALGGQVLTIQSDPNAERFYCVAGGVLSGTRESGSIRGGYLPVFEINLIYASNLQFFLRAKSPIYGITAF
jgi:hypothetical protein